MRKFFHFRFLYLSRFLSRFPGFSHPEKHSLGFLNSAQFLGALNDNIYKLSLIFFLIGIEGQESANMILSAAGTLFVIPFLLFSSMAGLLADRFSKSRLITLIKAAEIVIIALVILSFSFKEKWSGYALLFLLATQSALFGPPKYSIIPELVPKNQVSKANGLITSFTYLAIIVGTFLASYLTELTGRNFVLIGFFCLFIAVIGFLSSFGIQYTPPKNLKKKIKFLFAKEIFLVLCECKKKRHLLIAMSAAAYFLFIGAFTQLNTIPFAIYSLHLSEVAGGYLFLATALGIALGAFLAGKASKTEIELGLSCIAGLMLFLCFLLMTLFHSIFLTVGCLFFLGVFGGFFIVPFETFIQVFSPEENRGHVVAATNFMSFVGVLCASFAIYFFNESLGLSSSKSFALMGFITLGFTLFLILRLSDLFLSYTSKKILMKLFPVKIIDLDLAYKSSSTILMLEKATWLKAYLLFGFLPHLNLLIPQYKKRRFPWSQNVFYSIHRISSPEKFEELVLQGKLFFDADTLPCIYLTQKMPAPEKALFPFQDLLKRKNARVVLVEVQDKENSREKIFRFSLPKF